MNLQTIRKNWLSLLSLMVALTALFYNTWRNEQTELNRNFRASGFEIIHQVASLQLLVDQALYSNKEVAEAPITGWTKVNFIMSLSRIMPPSVTEKANHLKSVWQQNWEAIDKAESANQAITKANRELEETVLDVLTQLK